MTWVPSLLPIRLRFEPFGHVQIFLWVLLRRTVSILWDFSIRSSEAKSPLLSFTFLPNLTNNTPSMRLLQVVNGVWLLAWLLCVTSMSTDRLLALAQPQGQSWVQLTLSGTPPSPRVFAATSGFAPVPPPYDPTDLSGMVVFGGTSSASFGGQYYNDVYVLNAQDDTSDGRAWTLLEVDDSSPSPAPRCLSAVAVDQNTMIMYMFGGFDGSNWYNDTWMMDLSVIHYPGTAAKWVFVDSGYGPSARCGMTMVYSAVILDSEPLLLLFGGGADKRQLYGDLWAFQPSGAEWVEMASDGVAPSPREFHGCYYYSYDGTQELLVFGGYDYGYTYYNDTTVLESGNPPVWAAIPPTGCPESRANFGGAVSNTEMIIYGGRGAGSAVYSDVWVLSVSGQSWEPVTINSGPGPGARYGVASGYFSQKPGLLVFGGEDDQGIVHGDLWWIPVGSNAY